MKRFLIAAAVPALVLGGCAPTMTADRGMAGAAMPADMTPEDRTAYVKMAAASDLFEIQSSQMALAKSQNAAVRQFAQMLVAHHTQTTQTLTAAAAAAGVPPMTPQLMPMQVDMLARLQAASGAGFDRLYMQQQVPAHEMALALHSNYASNGDAPPLRQAAAAATPIVRQHLDQARGMRM